MFLPLLDLSSASSEDDLLFIGPRNISSADTASWPSIDNYQVGCFPFIMKDLLVDENPVDFDADGHPSWMQLTNEPVNLMLIALVIWMTIHTA